MLRFVIIATAILMSAPARADGPFFWMNDLHVRSRAGIAFAVGNPPAPGGDALALTADASAIWNLGGNINLNARLPIALAFLDQAGDDSSAAAIGNLGLGITGIRATRSGGATLRLGAGGQLYLNTRSDGGDSGVAANAAGLLHLPDPGRWADANTVRGRGDFSISAGRFLFQVETNIDLHFRDGDDDVDLNIGLGPALRLTPAFSILAELSIVNITDDELVIADLGIRYRSRALLVGARLYLPTEDIAGENVIGAGFELAASF